MHSVRRGLLDKTNTPIPNKPSESKSTSRKLKFAGDDADFKLTFSTPVSKPIATSSMMSTARQCTPARYKQDFQVYVDSDKSADSSEPCSRTDDTPSVLFSSPKECPKLVDTKPSTIEEEGEEEPLEYFNRCDDGDKYLDLQSYNVPFVKLEDTRLEAETVPCRNSYSEYSEDELIELNEWLRERCEQSEQFRNALFSNSH